jgi:hypothetical protein
MEKFDISQLINKHVLAAKRCPYFAHTQPSDSSLLGYFEKGQDMGVAYSYLLADPAKGRDSAWLQFYGTNGNVYFVPVKNGYVDYDVLIQQGVKTYAQQAAEQKEKDQLANNPVDYYLTKYGKSFGLPILGVVVGLGVVKILVDKFL